MSTLGRVFAHLAGCAFLLGTFIPLGAHAAAADPVGSYIVVWRDDVDADRETDNFEQNENTRAEFRYSYAVKGFAAKLSAAQLSRLQRDSRVKFISVDREVQAVGPITGSDSAPSGVRRIDAATATMAKDASTVAVAVIDTGIQLNHPDLNAVAGKNCVRSNRAPNDDNGHGTHVSGTIGARNNGSGVVGVAPGTTLYAVKVLNSAGSGTWSQVICGIDWVTQNTAAQNIKVASMSLGGTGSSDNNCGNTNADALHQAICNSVAAGVTYVIAAGNSAADFAGSTPAAYPEVLTVTAMSDSDGAPGGTGGAPTCRTGENDDAYATFSNFAVAAREINHTVAGPGVCIYSTWTGSSYNTISGTSMATPHVSGTVALCLGTGGSSGPCTGRTPSQIVQKIRSDAQAHATSANGFNGDPFHPIASKYFGYLAYAGGYPPPTVSSISPTSGPVAGGTAVTITGTNFSSGATVSFGGVGATGTVVVDATTITTATPAHAAGAVDVIVTVGSQSGTCSSCFTYVGPPTVTAINPTSGPTGGGTSVTITGTGFDTAAGATTVQFGPSPATWVSCGSTTNCTATSPAGSGTVDVTVTVGGQTSATSAADRFTYVAVSACTATSFTANPASPQAPGTSVTLTASATGCSSAEFRWWIEAPGAAWRIVRDYGANTFVWNTTGLAPGTYRISVHARAVGSTAFLEAESIQPYTLSP